MRLADAGLKNCRCGASTGLCGFITRGTGKLDFNGYWEFPCPHGNDCIEHEDDFLEERNGRDKKLEV